MADTATGASWCLNLQPHLVFPQRFLSQTLQLQRRDSGRRLQTDSGELRQPLRLALSTQLGRPGSRRREIMREGAGAKGCPGKAWRGVRAARAPFQPGQVRLEGLHF